MRSINNFLGKSSKPIVLVLCLIVFGALYLQMTTVSDAVRECARAMNANNILDSLYEGVNTRFASAGKCDHCHGPDAAGIASTDAEGGDVNLVDDWSSTMMANSAKDPFWQAKVSHEVLINPGLQSSIETTCTSCHAPLGHFAATMDGADNYSIAQMHADSVALDGVSCLACHQQLPQPEVALHTGQLFFDENLIAYGQYGSPLISPMAAYSNYIPTFGNHVSDSKLCAACHSLITETVDLDGNLTGNNFVEQATWHEWLNSSYPAADATCQSCHLQQLSGQAIVLAAGFDTPPRPDFGLHTLAGGNTLMLGLMRDNREALNIYASEGQFNETINATREQLQVNSLLLEIADQNRTADTLFVDVKLTNKTGHKLPSGYPSRRMSVHLVVRDLSGNELFRSGGFDGQHFITEEDDLENHYNVIRSEEDVQIYEMVMGDVNGDETTVLTRGNAHLKDNRLVPLGFNTASPVYDTTEIVLGIPDSDFNHDPAEGSGTDVIHYHIPMDGFTAMASVDVEVYYQSLPPTWMQEIFSATTPEIESFEAMFDNADRSPVLMRSSSIEVPEFVSVHNMEKGEFMNLRRDMDHSFILDIHSSLEMSVYNIQGQLLEQRKFSGGTHTWKPGLSAGSYLLIFSREDGTAVVKKIFVD